MDLTGGTSLWSGGCGPLHYKTVMMLKKKKKKERKKENKTQEGDMKY